MSAISARAGTSAIRGGLRDNRIDIRVLPKLTAEDLKDLGVTLVGDRRMLLDAIAALREPSARSRLTGMYRRRAIGARKRPRPRPNAARSA